MAPTRSETTPLGKLLTLGEHELADREQHALSTGSVDQQAIVTELRAQRAAVAELTRERDILVATLHAAARLTESTCEWAEDPDDPFWRTQCGHLFEFMTDGPIENNQVFCGYCGKRLLPVPATEGTFRD